MHAPQGDKCDGSAIQKNSLCCEGDKYIKCPAENCHSLIGENIQMKMCFHTVIFPIIGIDLLPISLNCIFSS